MIRVLWEIPNASTWTGGVNYFCNLGEALLRLPERSVEPVLTGSTRNWPPPLCRMPCIPKYSTPPSSVWSPRYIRHWLEERIRGEDKDYERYLRRHNIEMMSHLTFPYGKTDIPLLAWIPDFQHRHLPHLFSRKEVDKRNKRQAQLAEIAKGILLSSEDARRDFNRYCPGYERKTHVLQFVAIPPLKAELPLAEPVLARHGIGEPYFHIPNQIWAHKNHGIILDALCVLRKRGRCPLVISTGQTEDYRQPNYFQSLIQRVKEAGLDERYRFLGLIDYPDMFVLMRSAVALINPSLFEGWSTTVEEGKSLGKRMLLSSLDVHREQAQDRASFFDPQNAEQLALLMEEALAAHDPERELIAAQKADEALPLRIREFGLEYEAIVHRVLEK